LGDSLQKRTTVKTYFNSLFPVLIGKRNLFSDDTGMMQDGQKKMVAGPEVVMRLSILNMKILVGTGILIP